MSFKGSGDVTNNIFGNREPLSDPLAHRSSASTNESLLLGSQLWAHSQRSALSHSVMMCVCGVEWSSWGTGHMDRGGGSLRCVI